MASHTNGAILLPYILFFSEFSGNELKFNVDRLKFSLTSKTRLTTEGDRKLFLDFQTRIDCECRILRKLRVF